LFFIISKGRFPPVCGRARFGPANEANPHRVVDPAGLDGTAIFISGLARTPRRSSTQNVDANQFAAGNPGAKSTRHVHHVAKS
jgi:hypothetical protein